LSVTLAPQHEAFIRKKIESGLYSDADQVLGEALRLLEERDKLATLRAAVAIGDEQIARGEVVEWTPDLMERLKREATENARNGKPIKADVRP
jgi:antitoxin ParD1/3/4